MPVHPIPPPAAETCRSPARQLRSKRPVPRLVPGLLLRTWLATLLTLPGCAGAVSPRVPVEPGRPAAAAVTDTAGLLTRLILIGDAGDPRIDNGPEHMFAEEPVLTLATRWAAASPERAMVVFLGDNAYNDGLPERGPRADSARVRLGAQLAVVERSGARGLFVPGNHDWGFGRDGVLRQQAFVHERLGPGSFLPEGASGGPVRVPLPGVELVVLDTEWWLRNSRGRSCDAPREELGLAIDSLRSLLGRPPASHRVLLSHHPLDTYGEHRAMGLFRRFGGRLVGATQDLSTRAYQCVRRQLTRVLEEQRPLVAAAGHEHSLQVLDGGLAAEYILVSGAGSSSRVKPVRRGLATRYAEASAGFMVLDFHADGGAMLYVVVVDPEPSGRVTYTQKLR